VSHAPEFSIIIPTYNRPSALRRALQAIEALLYPRESFEVIVVDDGSSASYSEVIADYRGRFALRWEMIPNSGPSRARNRGAELARGRFLAFVDDDCVVDPHWLSELAGAFARDPALVLGGRTVNDRDSNLYALTWHIILDMVYEFYNAEPERSRFFASNNMAIGALEFRRWGGFDDRYRRPGAEDREFCDRCRMNGARLVWVPSALLRHDPALRLSSYSRVFFNYGRGAYHYREIRAERKSGTMVEDLGFHAALPRLTLKKLARLPVRRLPGTLALLALWQVSNAAGFAYEIFNARCRKLPAQE
jgi:glycosyltransferase involved in cell wall biosynthesis